MKKKTIVKIAIDFLMLIVYLQLMFCYEINTLYHEVMGLAIAALFILHVALNAKTISGLTKKMLQGKLGFSKSLLVISDYLLPVGMSVVVATGVLIAKDLLIGPGGMEFVLAHTICSYLCLAILAAHVLLHTKYLMGIARKLIRSDALKATWSAAGALAITGLLVWVNLLGGRNSLISTSTTATSDTAALAAQVQDKPEDNSSASQSTTASRKHEVAIEESIDDTSSSEGDELSTSESTDESSDGGSTIPICTLCPKACPLTNLLCGKGTQWATSNGYL